MFKEVNDDGDKVGEEVMEEVEEEQVEVVVNLRYDRW